MSERAAQFRESRIDLLNFLASSEKQIEWQMREPNLDATEIMCWWLDDFIPESPLTKEAFSRAEIALLQAFDTDFHMATDHYPGPGPRVEELLRDTAWTQVTSHAGRLASVLLEQPNPPFQRTASPPLN